MNQDLIFLIRASVIVAIWVIVRTWLRHSEKVHSIEAAPIEEPLKYRDDNLLDVPNSLHEDPTQRLAIQKRAIEAAKKLSRDLEPAGAR